MCTYGSIGDTLDRGGLGEVPSGDSDANTRISVIHSVEVGVPDVGSIFTLHTYVHMCGGRG